MAKRKANSGVQGEVVYSVDITLQGTEPPIWRRLLIKDATLDELHDLIQASMGWREDHSHEFAMGKVRYGPPDSDVDFSFVETEYEDRLLQRSATSSFQIVAR